MIIKQELIKRIKDYFNLNIYETKVWLALLSKGVASAGEIAELSGVPRSRTYDVLDSLEKQGFALAKIGKPTKYIAVRPQIVLEKLKKNTLENAKEKVKSLDNLKGTKEYNELESLHNSSAPLIKREEISSAIKGKTAILSYAHDLLKEAEKEIMACVPAADLIEKARIFNSLFEKLKNKNVVLKLALKGSYEEFKQIQEKYKIKPMKTDLNSKFFIIDRKQVLFNLTNSDKEEEELAVWLNSEFFSQALAKMFESSLFENSKR